jgi:hypothetical protein
MPLRERSWWPWVGAPTGTANPTEPRLRQGRPKQHPKGARTR